MQIEDFECIAYKQKTFLWFQIKYKLCLSINWDECINYSYSKPSDYFYIPNVYVNQ